MLFENYNCAEKSHLVFAGKIASGFCEHAHLVFPDLSGPI
jgi:hypothetical protein